VWFEVCDDLREARYREMEMKEWKRAWKIKRIEEKNFDWVDLYPTLL
jgi:putative endonuclease